MSGASRRRPSAALVVAVIALVIALTGTAFAGPVGQLARRLINGSTIKPHSIAANRLKNHSITGLQLNASKLGTIPHARLADSATTAKNAVNAQTAANAQNAANATNAANAAELGGAAPSSFLSASKILRWSFSMNKGNPTHQIGTMGPLTFSATCTADGAKTNAVIGVTTSESGTFVSDSPENLPGVSATINVGDPPFAIVSQDTAVANDGNSGGFAAFTPSGAATVFNTAQTLGVAINTSAADCRFFGFLINDA